MFESLKNKVTQTVIKFETIYPGNFVDLLPFARKASNFRALHLWVFQFSSLFNKLRPNFEEVETCALEICFSGHSKTSSFKSRFEAELIDKENEGLVLFLYQKKVGKEALLHCSCSRKRTSPCGERHN